MVASVFGGSQKDNTTKEYKESILIGNLLALKGYKVKSGGYYGIMEAVSKGVSEVNGVSIGHTCKSFSTIKGNQYLSETIPANDIYDRLRMLIEGTDVFIIQRGGIGTLSELFLTLDVVRKLKVRPKIILIGEFWNDIMKSTSQLFHPEEETLYTIISDWQQINDFI
jgi:uncharacterized protein (TIGR00730 family)